jgi:predicted metal-dependent enzyme (double-stranded beta helix superfamily)
MDRVIDAFLDDVRDILDRDGAGDRGTKRLVARMGELIREPDILAAHEAFLAAVAEAGDGLYTDTGRQSQVLHTDETGLTLVRSRFDPGEPTPIHSHGTWGIVGVYAGRDRHEAWRRIDGGAGPGDAVVELVEERLLDPGDVAVIPHPPQDIHRQQGDGEPAYELVLFGANAMVIPRLIFDPAARTARQVIPGQR